MYFYKTKNSLWSKQTLENQSFSPLFSRKFSSFYKCQPNFLYFMKVLGQSSEIVEWDRIKFPTIRASLDNKHLPILLMAVKKAIFCSGLCSNLFLIRRIVRIIIFYLGKKHLNQTEIWKKMLLKRPNIGNPFKLHVQTILLLIIHYIYKMIWKKHNCH